MPRDQQKMYKSNKQKRRGIYIDSPQFRHTKKNIILHHRSFTEHKLRPHSGGHVLRSTLLDQC
uniref:Uncharacterized protein n=1 Tax=Zea mays TaxID=4577 RepID=C4IYG2_MAIZE|nr:unknown [Zea mays]ACR37074.1 unknown [Zea mays]